MSKHAEALHLQTIAANLTAIRDMAFHIAKSADEALQAAAEGNRHGAVGALMATGEDADTIAAMTRTIYALNKRAG